MREEMIKEMVNMVEEKTGARTTVTYVTKNNGMERTGITVRDADKNFAPTVYVDCLLDQIESGSITMQGAVDEIINVYEERRGYIPGIDDNFAMDKKYILERVEHRLVSEELNKRLLEEVPYRDFLDLAVTYSVIVNRDEDGVTTFVVKNDMMQNYGISEEELEKAAAKNTARSGFESFNIMEIMNSMQENDYEQDDSEMPMYVLTNKAKSHGATVMLYGKLFVQLADKYKSDLYVLPSSIHEVLVVPANLGMMPKELKETVELVNRKNVPEHEILSGTVYRWSRKDGEMSIAE